MIHKVMMKDSSILNRFVPYIEFYTLAHYIIYFDIIHLVFKFNTKTMFKIKKQKTKNKNKTKIFFLSFLFVDKKYIFYVLFELLKVCVR